MGQTKPVVCEDDPLMVPAREVWERMSEREKKEKEEQIIAALEREFNLMGETTRHFDSRASITEVLRRFFKAKGQKIFVASDLHTLYPGERAFYPDLLVVFDAEDHHRRSWNVLREGKGLDFVLEILSEETKRKDQIEKLNLYARLGIPEYFMFDPDFLKLRGFTLTQNTYQEIPQHDRFCFSNVLGLRVQVDGDKIRFAVPDGIEIPFADELAARLNEKLSHKDALIEEYIRQLEEEKKRAEEEKLRAEEEKKRAEEEKLRADTAEKEIKRLRELLKSVSS